MNWVEIDRVLEELNLAGAFLQGVRQKDFLSLYLDFYQPGRPLTLVIGLEPGRLRLHPVAVKPPAPLRPLRFAEFLRARLVGARLASLEQFGKERVVVFSFSKGGEELLLAARLWGGSANLFVLDSQMTILEAAFRRPASGEIRGRPFHFPEPSDRVKTFALRDLPGSGSYGERLAAFYQAGGVDLEELRARALLLLERQEGALRAQRRRQETRTAEAQRAEDWKTWGDILLSDAWRIQAGSESFEGEDWRDGASVVIPLEPRLTAYENAEKWYQKARKANEAGELALVELEKIDRQIESLERIRVLLTEAAVEGLQDFLAQNRQKLSKQVKKDALDRPGLQFTSGDFVIWVGRNARENDGLLRRWVRGSDLWLHTRDVPGGFVFIRAIRGKSFPLETLLDAGNLAVWFSKAKGSPVTELYTTPVKYLKRAKDGPLGLVVPTQEKNLTIRLDQARLERLLGDKEEE